MAWQLIWQKKVAPFSSPDVYVLAFAALEQTHVLLFSDLGAICRARSLKTG
jgi:hypothetical protein